MKHLLNNLSSEERNKILEQYNLDLRKQDILNYLSNNKIEYEIWY